MRELARRYFWDLCCSRGLQVREGSREEPESSTRIDHSRFFTIIIMTLEVANVYQVARVSLIAPLLCLLYGWHGNTSLREISSLKLTTREHTPLWINKKKSVLTQFFYLFQFTEFNNL